MEFTDYPFHVGNRLLRQSGQNFELRSLGIDLDEVRSRRIDLLQDRLDRSALYRESLALRRRVALIQRISTNIPGIRRFDEFERGVAKTKGYVEGLDIVVGRHVALKKVEAFRHRLKRVHTGLRIRVSKTDRRRPDVSSNIQNRRRVNPPGYPVLRFFPFFKEDAIDHMDIAGAYAVIQRMTIPLDTVFVRRNRVISTAVSRKFDGLGAPPHFHG